MNTFDEKYMDLLRQVRHAPLKSTRQGIAAHMIPGATFVHDMTEGFPLTTLRKVRFDLIASELEFNLRGKTDKKWLQERGNHIWDDWCDPSLIPYASDEETKKRMQAERDLGPLYGFQWRHFGARYDGYGKDYSDKGVDQLSSLLKTLREKPESKRMVVSCWNPADLHRQSIPPCPFAFEISVFGGEMHLFLFQRSVDIMLGFPFDFAGYALLLHLLAKHTGLKTGKITAFFGNVELYVNQESAADELLQRPVSCKLPNVKTSNTSALLDWHYTDTDLEKYTPYPALRIPIAV